MMSAEQRHQALEVKYGQERERKPKCCPEERQEEHEMSHVMSGHSKSRFPSFKGNFMGLKWGATELVGAGSGIGDALGPGGPGPFLSKGLTGVGDSEGWGPGICIYTPARDRNEDHRARPSAAPSPQPAAGYITGREPPHSRETSTAPPPLLAPRQKEPGGAANMAERRRHKKRIQEVGEPSKEEKAVAKYLRFNCPTKSTNMMGHRVDYFIASKAVECLLDSKWAKAKKGEEALFTTRESVVDYCNRLLKKQFFHRALKVMKMKYDKDIKKEKEKGKSESGKEDDKKSKKESIKEEKTKKEKEKKKDGEKEDSKKEETPGTPKKKETKKKFKLEPHDDQVFLDGNEVFVWIYDPVHIKTFVMGLILVIAVIAATLFPLWPAEMRVGVYYLSVGAGCFVASILLLAIARCILFLIIWLITGGRHHFWFLPNLTADVGFIDSFRPLYTHEYKGPKADLKKDEKSEAKKQHKSDSEEKSDSEKKEDEEGKGAPGDHGPEGSGGERHSDTDSDRREDDRSQHSSGNGNDFEMITKEELEQQTDGDCDEEDDDKDGEMPKSAQEKS
uniref:Translocation protein SEC62 n=1 Tax=Rattus norvegicus TaxID=10116 RepID=A0A8I6A8V9_RAT